MTLSHFDSFADAEAAIDKVKGIVGAAYSANGGAPSSAVDTVSSSIDSSNSSTTLGSTEEDHNVKPFTFMVREVYVMQRHDGWSDQFRIVWTLPLRGSSKRPNSDAGDLMIENDADPSVITANATATATATSTTVDGAGGTREDESGG
jgi:hypothetical protein